MVFTQLYKTVCCFLSTPDEVVNKLAGFNRSSNYVISPFLRPSICKKIQRAWRKIVVSSHPQSDWHDIILVWEKTTGVYSCFSIKNLLFELKKRSSKQIVSPFSGKLIGMHHEVARAVVRAPSAKTFTSTKLAFYHFLNMILTSVGFPRVHPRTHRHSVRQSILQ